MTFEQLFISYALNGIPFNNVVRNTKDTKVVDIRRASIHLLKDNYKTKELALFFRQSQSTIIYSIHKVQDLIDIKDKRTLDTIKLLQSKIQ